MAQPQINLSQLTQMAGKSGMNMGQLTQMAGKSGMNMKQLSSMAGQSGMNMKQLTQMAGQSGMNMGQMSSMMGKSGMNMGQLSSIAGQSGMNMGQMSSMMGKSGMNMSQLSSIAGQSGMNMGQLTQIAGQSGMNMKQLSSIAGQSGMNMKQLSSIAGQSGMNMKQLSSMAGQSGMNMSQSSEFDKIKDVSKIFDLFKPAMLDMVLKSVQKSGFEEFKDMKTLKLRDLKRISRFIYMRDESDIQRFLSNFAKSFGANINTSFISEMMNGNSMDGLYMIKDICSILMELSDEMYDSIESFVKDQIKMVKKAMNEGKMTNAIDVKLIPKLLHILDQLSIANMDKMINIATTKFELEIPVNGFQMKALLKGLKIIFPLKKTAKMTEDIKDEMRYLLGMNDIKSDESKIGIEKFKALLQKEDTLLTLSNYPYQSYREVEANVISQKNTLLILLLLIQSFYITHNPKLYDKDELKKHIKEVRKANPTATEEQIKMEIQQNAIYLYEEFIYQKGMILAFAKLALHYYTKPRSIHHFMNIFYHFFRVLRDPKIIRNLANYITETKTKKSRKDIDLYTITNEMCISIFGVEAKSVIEQIYMDVFANSNVKAKLVRMSRTKSEFVSNYQSLLSYPYYVYISNTFQNNVSQLRMNQNKSINITRPTYFSIHELKLSEYEALNKFILRAKFNNTNKNSNKKKSENENENENENKNQMYTKEDLNRILEVMEKRMYQNEELNKYVRNKDPHIYNSRELIAKMKHIYKFEVFLLLVYKKYQKKINTRIYQTLFPNPYAPKIFTLI